MFKKMFPIKYLKNFWRTLEILFVNCKISIQLECSKYCMLVASTAANQEPDSKITDTKVCVLVVILSTNDNIKLLRKIKSGFKRAINCNKYQFKTIFQTRNRYLDCLRSK